MKAIVKRESIWMVIGVFLALPAFEAPAQERKYDFSPPDLDQKMAALSAKFDLPARDGIPVVEFHRLGSVLGRDGFTPFSKFMDAVALGLFPRFVEIHGPTFMNVHASLEKALEFGGPVRPIRNISSMRRPLVVRFQWKSKNEFETRELQQAFIAKYGANLREMQVDLPIRLILTQQIRLGLYDFDRQGFKIGETWDENGFGGELLGFAGTNGEFKIRPASFYSVSQDDLLRVATPPTVIRGLVKVAPEVAKTITPTRQSRDRTLHAAAVVTLHEAPLACSAVANHRHVVARLDSLSVFSDERLSKKVADLDFAQHVPSVLETGVERAFVSKCDSLPADQLAVIGLVAEHYPESLGEEQWERIWYYMMDRDKRRYFRASQVLKDLRGNRERFPDPVTEGEQWMDASRFRMHVAEPTFFPHGYRATVRGRKSFQFRPGQIESLRSWLIRRVKNANGRFCIRGEIQRADPPRISVPRGFVPPPGSRFDATMDYVIKNHGPEGRFVLLDKPAAGWECVSHLIATDGSRVTVQVVKFPNELQTLIESIPQEILQESLSRLPHRKTFELEFAISRVERIEVIDAPDAVLLHAEPKRLRLLNKSGAIDYEGSVTMGEYAAKTDAMKRQPQTNATTGQLVVEERRLETDLQRDGGQPPTTQTAPTIPATTADRQDEKARVRALRSFTECSDRTPKSERTDNLNETLSPTRDSEVGMTMRGKVTAAIVIVVALCLVLLIACTFFWMNSTRSQIVAVQPPPVQRGTQNARTFVGSAEGGTQAGMTEKTLQLGQVRSGRIRGRH